MPVEYTTSSLKLKEDINVILHELRLFERLIEMSAQLFFLVLFFSAA